MGPIETLKHEHRVIEMVLDAIDAQADRVRAGRVEAPELKAFSSQALDFVRGFADQCHHAKEEGVLFRAMAEAGVRVEGGPLGVMLAEHEVGRACVREAAESLGAGDLARTAERLAAYAKLLRQHIDKEDNVLYAMAEGALDRVSLEGMGAEFDRIEAEEVGEGTHDRYHEFAHRLRDSR
ncbi:MAG: hemerythrin domain-containing protein [Bacillota bacterium]